jgi:translation initiation factor 4A
MQFEQMNLKENLLRGIFSHGFQEPSKIQSQTIPYLSEPMGSESGGDLLAQAQSGTGKTGAFLISTLQLVNEDLDELQSIILAPTKELATQIYTVCLSLNQYLGNFVELCVGGIKNSEQKRGIAIGTPGKILDLIEREYFNLKHLKFLVLDEADEMLSKNFEDQMYNIVKRTPKSTRIAMFSATLTREIIDLSKKIMVDPKIIKLEPEEITLDGITQYYIHCEKEMYKFDALCELYNRLSFGQTFIYINSRKWGEKLCELLEAKNFVISFIHAGLSHNERTQIMKDFNSGKSRILLSTNLLARGIDIQQVSVVINYDVPVSKETYIHRIGRSGRFGRKGVAINLVSDKDLFVIDELEQFYSTKMTKVVSVEDIII